VVDEDGNILQLGNDTGSCQARVNPEAGETVTVHNQDASMDMPLENIVHIEDVSRTTLVATILEVVAGLYVGYCDVRCLSPLYVHA